MRGIALGKVTTGNTALRCRSAVWRVFVPSPRLSAMLPSLGTQPVRVFHGSADKGTFDDKMMGLKYMEVVTPYSFKRFSGSPYQNSQLSVFNPLAVGNNWDDESSSTAIAVGFSLTRSKKSPFQSLACSPRYSFNGKDMPTPYRRAPQQRAIPGPLFWS